MKVSVPSGSKVRSFNCLCFSIVITLLFDVIRKRVLVHYTIQIVMNFKSAITPNMNTFGDWLSRTKAITDQKQKRSAIKK